MIHDDLNHSNLILEILYFYFRICGRFKFNQSFNVSLIFAKFLRRNEIF